MVKCGVYKITSPTGRVYIGQAVNLARRMDGYSMPSTSSQQPKLNNSFKKYGVENHTFEIIEECLEEDLNCHERHWQDFYDVLNGGLNCGLTQCGEKRYVHSEETREKIRLGKLGDKNPNWGKKMSKESAEKRNNNPNRKSLKGIPRTEDDKQKMRGRRDNILRGKNPNSKITLCLQTGIFYDCLKDACEALGLHYKNTMNKIRKNRSKILIYV